MRKANKKHKLKDAEKRKKAASYNFPEKPVEFYKLLNEGLFQKYCRDAGSVQELNITYKNKSDIRILQKGKVFDSIEIDFIGDFVEEKIINADLSNPIYVETRLNEIKGTIFIRDSMTEDLILEL